MRAELQLVDAVMGFFVLVAILALAPFTYQFIGMVSAESDPLTALLMQLIPPLLLIGLVVSIGVSAR
ncbi:hypothetical protein C5B90_06405 [Haloferax sp. Atlit-12N]|uniref:hypothetical protein n=1 Tax=Haloferax sp. Atlit-12N TaxID=2077203 RepID=UPI000E26BD2D|nr:hypothetical protein [Haloferax sp. Atlit-12N]RDZ65975.1 hypothetical protein C5B90_06405 [Haloferax sp. Atlit-12N]